MIESHRDNLLSVANLCVDYAGASGHTRAVDGVSFGIARGKTLAVVGASGSGKSSLALALTGLLPANASVTGRTVLHGDASEGGDVDIASAGESALRGVRGRRVGLVFQSPGSALDPIMRIDRQLAEVVRRHCVCARRERTARIGQLLADVQLEPDVARQYPHMLSGGMQQRVALALALAGTPQLLIADEPTSALDVTVQAQLLTLLRNLQRSRNLTVLFITHDLAVAAQVADHVAVMDGGRVVESRTMSDLLRTPRHTATIDLLAAAREIDNALSPNA